MNVTVDGKAAEKKVRTAIDSVTNQGWEPSSRHSEEIQQVILGTHKTYRYILLNGLLAKATNFACNPVVLQAGSTLTGAFDARSLCHGVVVPIERELLGDRLGASNEPFLNKPARFTELSENNAVRRGNDTLLLKASINVLSNISNEEEAEASLNDCIYWIFKRESRDLSEFLSSEGAEPCQSSLIPFARRLLQDSIEGETSALLAGTTFSILGCMTNRNFEVKAHKVNQAGSSSKEISDVDVYENGELIYTAEVKDKEFTSQDVEHAISKVAVTGHKELIFIKGPRGRLTDKKECELTALWAEKGFSLYFLDNLVYFKSILSLSKNIDRKIFIDILNKHADYAKVKDQTLEHITECIKKEGW